VGDLAVPVGGAAGAPLAPPRRRLLTGVEALDRFMGPLVGGRVAMLRGLEHAPSLLPRIVVAAVLELGEDAVVVDGGNAADPYRLSAACRRLGARPEDVLSRVHVARAFTSFQMSAIVEGALPRAVDEHVPGLLAVLSVDELYHDDNVGRDQAAVLLGRAMDRVRSLAADRGLIAVLGDSRAHRARPGDRFAAVVDARVDQCVSLERRSARTLRLRRRDGAVALLAAAPPGQLTLDDFARAGPNGPQGRGDDRGGGEGAGGGWPTGLEEGW
jgi:hypothetical protein